MDYDIGFLGGGQLARMSVQAAQRMGMRCLVLDADPGCPAGQLTDNVVASLDDQAAQTEMFRRCERVTLENEFVLAGPLAQSCRAAGRHPETLLPGASTLALIQDKLAQRRAYRENGVPSPLAVSVEEGGLPFPLVLKARHGGYDGRGTRFARDEDEWERHRHLWAGGGWLAEQMVSFRRELAVMVCRWREGACCFPTMETRQVDHICDLVLPACVDASAVALQAVEAVEGYGLFGVELFELADGSFQVNEIAPRPHNSGHFTLDWGGISQFEAHVRLTKGWSVPDPVGMPFAMANLVSQAPATAEYGRTRLGAATEAAYLAEPECHVHWYGKAEARPGRKMGHINAPSAEAAVRARAAFWEGWGSSDRGH